MPLPIAAVAGLADLDRVAGVEGARDVDDADRQQRRPALAQRPRGAGVDAQRPVRRLGVLQPQLEARVAARPGRKRVPAALARPARAITPGSSPEAMTVAMPAAVAISAATTFERMPPEPSGDVACADLSAPSASKSATSSTSSRRRVHARVGGVEAVGVGQQHEQLGAEQHRHLRGQEVVVAEGDLVGGGRVVLVDDRHDPPVEQLAQRAPRVEVVRARAHVEEREQHLRRSARARAAARRRRGRAGPGRRRWPPAAPRSPRAHGQLEQLHPARDRARGDDDDVDAGGVQRRDLVADARDARTAQVAASLRRRRRSRA